MHDCLIAFGSNEGQSKEIFEQALVELDQKPDLRVSTCSPLLSTEPVGGPKDQPNFLNAVIRIETSNTPFEVYRYLVEIESRLGRVRKDRWGPRRIDLDLLIFDQLRIQTENLVVPHPRMSFRRFVLEPAAEIAGKMMHVTSGRTIEQLVQHLDERDDLIVYVSRDVADDPLCQIATAVPVPWDFRAVTHREFAGYEHRAKLVAYSGSDDELIESSNRQPDHVSFPGPTLELPVDFEQAKAEIEAAIEAMAPLDDVRKA